MIIIVVVDVIIIVFITVAVAVPLVINVFPSLCQRALRAGERVHTAMEVVEIVRHEDCSQHTDSHSRYDDTDDEQEATRRNADLNSQELCRVWVQLHFQTDDGSSCDVKNDR